MKKGKLLTYNQILSLGDNPLVYLTYFNKDGSPYLEATGWGNLDFEEQQVQNFNPLSAGSSSISIMTKEMIDNPTTEIDCFEYSGYTFCINEAIEDDSTYIPEQTSSKEEGMSYIIDKMAEKYSTSIICTNNEEVEKAYKQGVYDILNGSDILSPDGAVEALKEARKLAGMSPVNKDYLRLIASFNKIVNKIK